MYINTVHRCDKAKMQLADLLSLERQYTFYHGYHQNRKNRVIHIISVPVLFCTLLVVIAYLFPVKLKAPFVLGILYQLYVASLDTMVSLTFMPFLAVQIAIAETIRRNYLARDAIPPAIAFHVLAWLAQLVGHYWYESNSPAVMESLVHAVLAAPIVIYLETLFSFGLFANLHTRLARSRVVRKVKTAQKKANRKS